jgi:hypothetical protein
MTGRNLHLIHVIVPRIHAGTLQLLFHPHDRWSSPDAGQPCLALPAKKTVTAPYAENLRGQSLELFLDLVMQDDLHLEADEYVWEQELPPVALELPSPTHHEATVYRIYPVVVWVDPARHDSLREAVCGQWLSLEQALPHQQLSPTARCVLEAVGDREAALDDQYRREPESEHRPDAPRRLRTVAAEGPSMDGLARRWRTRNRSGVSVLPRAELDRILERGSHAFNLRVADPYLSYQKQGLGFTWSFFTHKDPQDVHVHGSPIVEVYGVLEGRLEVWWKGYEDRGTSAWSHRVLGPGDWAEVESLHCHIVRWLGEGKGVVFKAGPGPLAEVGRLGVKGKTPCKDCTCMKPDRVCELERSVEK